MTGWASTVAGRIFLRRELLRSLVGYGFSHSRFDLQERLGLAAQGMADAAPLVVDGLPVVGLDGLVEELPSLLGMTQPLVRHRQYEERRTNPLGAGLLTPVDGALKPVESVLGQRLGDRVVAKI